MTNQFHGQNGQSEPVRVVLPLKRVFLLVMPSVHMLDLAGPLQVLSTLQEVGIAPVSTECISPQRALHSFQNVALRDIRPLPFRLEEDDALFVIGSKLDDALMRSQSWTEAAAWLRSRVEAQHAQPQVCGVCTGTFLLAHAGLLDGRVCTTHHRFTQQLQRSYPGIHVVDNRLLVRDGPFWTSAGVASGIDLALHLIAEAFGDDAAVQVARENVVQFRRFGNDPELGVPLRHRGHGNQLVHAVQDAIGQGLASGATCEALAQRFQLSYRHLARLFVAETGITMKDYQVSLRMDLARRLVIDSNLPIEQIVERCGFGSVQAFRANWDKREALTPSRLRKLAAKRNT
jgi:transcriptional regulator GlxA family with amidase domain